MKALKHLLLTTLVILAGATAANAQLPGVLLNDADREFLRAASQGAAYETIAGNLTVSHSDTNVVRRFGKLVSRDNLREANKLRALSLRLGLTISIEPSPEQNTELSKLGELYSGPFDRTYVNRQITTILNDIRDSLVVIRDGNNVAVRAFARNRLVSLNAELQRGIITAQQIGLSLR